MNMDKIREKFVEMMQTEGIKEEIAKGTCIGKNNDVANAIYYLEQGVCGLVRYTKEGEEVNYHYFQSGDLLGGVYFNLAEEAKRYQYRGHG